MSDKILFIEDEEEIIDLMRMRLEGQGYTFSAAFNGEDGLIKAGEDKPGLILLDIVLPRIDGLTVCRKLKSNPQTKGIPVIMISAIGSRDISEKCRQAGAEDFISKPFEAQELLDKIARFLKKERRQ